LLNVEGAIRQMNVHFHGGNIKSCDIDLKATPDFPSVREIGPNQAIFEHQSPFNKLDVESPAISICTGHRIILLEEKEAGMILVKQRQLGMDGEVLHEVELGFL
jgi:hypothetical protein